jgi:XRE family aerobic/anaerobic benzoate catabolism transcriptional regulator
VGLAARSGLSLRFLAQLEAGDSNISLLRLMDVASALDLDLADLIRDAGAVPQLPTRPGRENSRLIALLGLRGAGKSSVGRRLAARLRLPFQELDSLVERRAGLPIGQIFELHGEAYFRRLEREALLHFVATVQAGVLATGGGIVTEPETMAVLLQRCTTVWLRAQPEEHWQRVVRQGDRRPMRDNPDAMVELRALLERRESLYARAHHTVETSKQSVVQVANVVLRSVRGPLRSE